VARHLTEIIDEMIETYRVRMTALPKFKIISSGEELEDIDGHRIYIIEADDEVLAWMKVTFVEGKDYITSRTLKGVWIETSDSKIITLLRLKWTTN